MSTKFRVAFGNGHVMDAVIKSKGEITGDDVSEILTTAVATAYQYGIITGVKSNDAFEMGVMAGKLGNNCLMPMIERNKLKLVPQEVMRYIVTQAHSGTEGFAEIVDALEYTNKLKEANPGKVFHIAEIIHKPGNVN